MSERESMDLKRAGSFSDPYKVENSRLDADTVEEGLAALLRATPQARVTAIDARGVFVPMPPRSRSRRSAG